MDLKNLYEQYENLLWGIPWEIDLAISTIIFLVFIAMTRTDSLGYNLVFIFAGLVAAALWGPLALVLPILLPPAAAIWALAYLMTKR